ncbi:MAG TPA: patatin-like phospholipase family protein [Solirubrobacteraceae bacterium]|nr:patatin-like phospholipase family protein [Solirubrobacteraceae bacterium]
MLSRPDVLVLGGGGVLGEQWLMGVLAGIEDATGFDMRDCESFVGTSAGSIVAARLAAGRSLRRPDVSSGGAEEPDGEEPAKSSAAELARRAGRLTLAAWAPFAPLALAATGPGGAFMRAGVLTRLGRPRRVLDDLRTSVERYGARFDGPLRIAAVDRLRGRRVMFGAPGAPHATVAQAVQASCAVPWLFAPVTIAGREYVDGGVWSATNLDAAPAGRDTHVLCLNPTAGINGTHTLVSVARTLARSAVSVEALALKRRGAIVQTVAPDVEAAAAMAGDFMDPEPRSDVLAAGYRQGLRLARAGPR